MLKKISWLIAGLISLKIVNEIGYILINVSGEGVVVWKAFLPALTGCLLLGFCLLKGDVFFEYSKKLGTKKLNRIYKVLITSFCISMLFMVAYFFLATSQSPITLNKLNPLKSALSSEACSNESLPFYRFKINEDKNVVIREIHADNGSGKDTVFSEAYKNCQVVDRLNWICGDSPKKYMVDGKFYIDWPDGTKEICVK
jgi:hypothetical protein